MLDQYKAVESQPKLKFEGMHHRFQMDEDTITVEDKVIPVESLINKGSKQLMAFTDSGFSMSQVPAYVDLDFTNLYYTAYSPILLARSQRHFMVAIPALRTSNWKMLEMCGSFRVNRKSRSRSNWAERVFPSIHWMPHCMFIIHAIENQL